MSKLPVSIIIDDPAPGIHVYYHHVPGHTLEDGQKLLPFVPNDMLYDFCGLVEEYGLGGKFSVVPMPGCQGDLIHGLKGVSEEALADWISTVRTRIMPYFDICPEILTHAGAIDLATGEILPMNEKEWCVGQTRETLTPYIARSLELLDQAGLTPTGVTSPWDFGSTNEGEYQQAVSRAFDQVLGVKDAWYFLHSRRHCPEARPQLVLNEDGRRLVSIFGTFTDYFWSCIDTTDTSDELVRRTADHYITADGKAGDLIELVEAGCPPVLLTHWQSLFSNGRRTGLRALRLVCVRMRIHLSDRVEWVNMSELMRRTLNGAI